MSQKEIIPSKTIAYLPQDSFLPKELKVRDVIPFFFPNGEDQDKIFYASTVSVFEKLKVGYLSLGQLRYLELLIIGNLNHSFLLLDEPFSMIEPLYKEIIKSLLLELKKTKGIILTDHYYDDVLEITNKNLVIKDAEKIEIHSKEDLVKFQYLSSNI
jgi:ABC-type lipopolysaccharide export system ATPase subunit